MSKLPKDLRVALFLQRRFAYLGHALALEFQRMGVRHFAGYTMPYRSAEFLQNQKDISYESLIVDEDIMRDYRREKIDFAYLRKMEERYPMPNFWKYIYVDRYLMMSMPRRAYSYQPSYGYEDLLRILQVKLRAIDSFLDEYKPDVIVFSSISILPSYLMSELARAKGIQVLQLATTRVEDRVALLTNIEHYAYVFKRFHDLRALKAESASLSIAKNYLNSYRERPLASYRADFTSHPKSMAARISKDVRFFGSYAKRYFGSRMKDDYLEESPIDFLRNRIAKKLNAFRGVDDLTEKPLYDRPYVYFPLHLEPEAATLLYAPYYTNQPNLIRSIALSIPIDWRVYVKEHPAMTHIRPRSYYKELRMIPNVLLVPTKTSSQELTRNAKLVTTITGTAGWEAILLGKPVITFGEVFYNILSSVLRCESVEELPALIRRAVANTHDDSELSDYLAAVYDESVKLDYLKIWAKDSFDAMRDNEGVHALAQYIMSKIGVNEP